MVRHASATTVAAVDAIATAAATATATAASSHIQMKYKMINAFRIVDATELKLWISFSRIYDTFQMMEMDINIVMMTQPFHLF